MEDRKRYIDKMAARLKEWDAEIQRLEAKADDVTADAKAEYRQQIDDVRSKKKKAQQKLKEIQEAGKDSWEDLKQGLEGAWDSLGNALKSTMSRFQ